MNFVFTNPLLIINVLLLLGVAAIYFIDKHRVELIRRWTLYLSITVFGVGVLSCLSFNQSMVGFQFLWSLNIVFLNNLTFTLGADGLTMIFLLLTLFIFPICFAAAWSVTHEVRAFYLYLLSMEILLVLTFTTLDLFYFYVFFESLLIPMFILIGIWGARERKIKAAYLFFLYTLFGSLIMLFGVLYLYLITGSTNYFVLLNTTLEADQQKLIWLCFFMAFAVKMPLFPFHIWLPEAHVEAPTVGSMLLASLLLKLGGYGFLRFSLTLLQEGSVYFSALVSTLALLGVVYGSLATIRQIDLKRIIAYSSVAHMNLVMLGLFSGNQQGIEGAVYLMVGHGVVSAALFFCVGVLYDRYHSRLLRYYGGLVTAMPVFSFFLFSFTLANMSFPGTSNFLGELLLFLGVYANNSTVLLFSTAGIVLSAVYSVWLYNRVAFGTLKTKYIARFTEANRRETGILAMLLLSMFILGVTADFILNFIRLSVNTIASGSAAFMMIFAARPLYKDSANPVFTSRQKDLIIVTLIVLLAVTVIGFILQHQQLEALKISNAALQRLLELSEARAQVLEGQMRDFTNIVKGLLDQVKDLSDQVKDLSHRVALAGTPKTSKSDLSDGMFVGLAAFSATNFYSLYAWGYTIVPIIDPGIIMRAVIVYTVTFFFGG